MPTRRQLLAGPFALALTSKLQAATPVVVGSKLDLEGALLKPVFAGFDLKTLRRLNERIAVDAEDPKAVARDYFERQGVLN